MFILFAKTFTIESNFFLNIAFPWKFWRYHILVREHMSGEKNH